MDNEEIIDETLVELSNRVNKALEYIKNLDEKNIGIITHHDFLLQFTAKISNNGHMFRNCEKYIFNF